MKKKILVKAPLLSRSGYGEQSRFALRALRTREDLFDIYALNLNWGGTGQIAENSEESQYIKNSIEKLSAYANSAGGQPTFDISLQITVPNEFEKIAPVNIGYTAGIETTRVAGEWIQKSNAACDKLIVISNHSKKVFEQTKYDIQTPDGTQMKDWGLQVPVEVVNYPVREHTAEELNIDLVTDTNYLCVAQWGVRKNMENTINWFVEEFKDNPAVGLIVKTNSVKESILDREHTTARLTALLGQHKDRKCKIYLLHGEVSPGQLTWLYQHPTMKALINIGHGEGFGLPMFEAAYNGLPLITVPWSGQLDFICKPNKNKKNVPKIIKVDYDLKPVQAEAVWKGVIEAESMWCYPREASYKKALRESLTKEKHYKKEAKILQKHILKNFTAEKMYEQFRTAIYDPSPEELEWLEQMEDIQIL